MIELSNIDLFFASPKAKPSNLAFWFDESLDHDLLQRSLVALGALYPPICSTLRVVDAHTLALVPTGEPLILGRRAGPLPQELELARRCAAVRTAPGEPLVRLTHWQAPQGSVLWMSFAHVLGDAAACFDLLMAWVALASGRSPRPPHLDRGVFRAIFGEAEGPAPGSLVEAGLRTERPAAPITAADVASIQRVVISRAQLRGWSEASARALGRRLPSFALIAAEVWREAARSLAPEAPVGVACPVDLRRLLPELPPRYFGNALRPAVARASAGEVLSLSAVERAARVDAAIRGVDRATLAADYRLVEALRRHHGLAGMANQRVTGLDTVMVSDVSFAPTALIHFGGRRCTGMSLLSLYARTAAVLPHAEGYQVVRAGLKE